MASLPTTTPQTHVEEHTDEEYEPLFHLVLLDDDEHTYQYVIDMVGAIFGYGREKGFAIACMVDSDGRAILMTGSHEAVKDKQDAVHAYGPDPRMPVSKGSMSAIIERADTPTPS